MTKCWIYVYCFLLILLLLLLCDGLEIDVGCELADDDADDKIKEEPWKK